MPYKHEVAGSSPASPIMRFLPRCLTKEDLAAANRCLSKLFGVDDDVVKVEKQPYLIEFWAYQEIGTVVISQAAFDKFNAECTNQSLVQ